MYTGLSPPNPRVVSCHPHQTCTATVTPPFMSQLLPTPATPLCDIEQCLSSLVHFLYCAVRAWIPVSPGLEGSLRGLMLWLSSCTRWERVTEDRRDMGSPVDRLGEPCREVKGHSISRAVPKRPHGQGCVSPKHPVQPTQTRHLFQENGLD